MYPTLLATPGVAGFAAAVDSERQAQLTKWGDQHHPDDTGGPLARQLADIARLQCQRAAAAGKANWADILHEEVCEALAESDPARLRAELVQVAAVCAAWIYDIDRRPPPAGAPYTETAARADVAFLDDGSTR